MLYFRVVTAKQILAWLFPPKIKLYPTRIFVHTKYSNNILWFYMSLVLEKKVSRTDYIFWKSILIIKNYIQNHGFHGLVGSIYNDLIKLSINK